MNLSLLLGTPKSSKSVKTGVLGCMRSLNLLMGSCQVMKLTLAVEFMEIPGKLRMSRADRTRASDGQATLDMCAGK